MQTCAVLPTFLAAVLQLMDSVVDFVMLQRLLRLKSNPDMGTRAHTHTHTHTHTYFCSISINLATRYSDNNGGSMGTCHGHVDDSNGNVSSCLLGNESKSVVSD